MKKIKRSKPSQANSLEKGKHLVFDSSSDPESSNSAGGILEAQLAEVEINCLEIETNYMEHNQV
jgi:hypothetical protein